MPAAAIAQDVAPAASFITPKSVAGVEVAGGVVADEVGDRQVVEVVVRSVHVAVAPRPGDLEHVARLSPAC